MLYAADDTGPRALRRRDQRETVAHAGRRSPHRGRHHPAQRSTRHCRRRRRRHVHGMTWGFDPDVWMSFRSAEKVLGSPPSELTDRTQRWLHMIARLRPGTTEANAAAEVSRIAAGIAHDFPAISRDHTAVLTAATITPPGDRAWTGTGARLPAAHRAADARRRLHQRRQPAARSGGVTPARDAGRAPRSAPRACRSSSRWCREAVLLVLASAACWVRHRLGAAGSKLATVKFRSAPSCRRCHSICARTPSCSWPP